MRIGTRAIDALTIVHKLTAVLWFAATVGLLISALQAGDLPGLFHPPLDYPFRLIAAGAALVTLLVGIAYGILTDYGFLANPVVAGKWALTVAVVFGGFVAVGGFVSARTAVLFLAGKLAAFIALTIAGVRLEVERHKMERLDSAPRP